MKKITWKTKGYIQTPGCHLRIHTTALSNGLGAKMSPPATQPHTSVNLTSRAETTSAQSLQGGLS